MKTSDLIDTLASRAQPIPFGQAWRLLGAALASGGALALVLVVVWLHCQSLALAAVQPWFWTKASYTSLLAVAGAILVRRLATPGAPLRSAPWLALAVLAVMASLGAAELLTAEPARRLALWLGQTWQVCAPLILLLSVPIYGALIVAVRTLAPVHAVRAGAAAGLAAGALAATLYGLHCPEQSAAFVATWYSLGIAGSAALGGLGGRWLLRW